MAKTHPLKPGENCWRTSTAVRGGFMISGRQYFRAFRRAVLQAEKSVFWLAWDLSEKVETVRLEEDDDGYPSPLADFIFAVLDAKPSLHVHILLWNYSMVYAAEREWLPLTQWRQRSHPRLHLELDDAINIGASHHQKVVVVDESLAFLGGFDLSAWRWDTTAHAAKDERRRTPAGELYQPFHDIQLALTGPVAKDLADLCAIRWERATGAKLPRIETPPENAPWPDGLPVDFKNQEVGLALTFSRYKEYEPSRHIEQSYLEIIAEAERYIYIENQYLSSHDIVHALAQRLREPDGPEVVVVLTRDTGGWIEEGTMGVLRDRLLEILSEADQHERFGVYFPHVEDENGASSQVYVHAKLLIVDDRILETGSANLSNRSMKVDSEVDLIVARDDKTEFIQQLLIRLLAMHFQAGEDDVRSALNEEKGLNAAIAALRDGHLHRLDPLEVGCNSYLGRNLANTQLLDPDEPISPAYWMREWLREEDLNEEDVQKGWKSVLKVAMWVGLGVAVAYGVNEAWGSVISKDKAIGFMESFRSSPYALLILLVVFFVAGLIAIPVNLLLVAGTIVMGPWQALGCGLVGSLASAAAAFGLGNWLGKPQVERFAGPKIGSLSKKIGSRGVASVALIRILPVAPFVVVNVVAGFSRLTFSIFMKGSVLGMVPGMLAVVWLTYQVRSLLEDPTWTSCLGLGLAVLLFGFALYLVRRHFSRPPKLQEPE